MRVLTKCLSLVPSYDNWFHPLFKIIKNNFTGFYRPIPIISNLNITLFNLDTFSTTCILHLGSRITPSLSEGLTSAFKFSIGLFTINTHYSNTIVMVLSDLLANSTIKSVHSLDTKIVFPSCSMNLSNGK